MSAEREHSLGIHTEFVAGGQNAPLATDPSEGVAWRFYLQSLARELLPDMRVAGCMRRRSYGRTTVEVRYSDKTKRAWYHGLQRCGSNWVCPWCSAKITEQRREELTLALQGRAGQYIPVLVTLTCRHDAGMRLLPLVDKLLAAYRSMLQERAWRYIREEYSIKGSIRSLEVTHGAHGWHPHLHILFVVDAKIITYEPSPDFTVDGSPIPKDPNPPTASELLAQYVESFQTQLENNFWLQALAKYGLQAELGPAVKVTAGHEYLVEYVAKYGRLPKEPAKEKWTVEQELVKGPVKKAHLDGRTPFQLLEDYGQGDVQAGKLFVEYAEAMFGRSQLQWTPGLKEHLGVINLSDAEIAENNPTEFDLLAVLTPAEWRAIIRADARAEVLRIARTGDSQAVMDFIYGLPDFKEENS